MQMILKKTQKHTKKQVRRIALKIFERVRDSIEIVGVKDKNTHTACVYLACGMAKINLVEKPSTTVERLVEVLKGVILRAR